MLRTIRLELAALVALVFVAVQFTAGSAIAPGNGQQRHYFLLHSNRVQKAHIRSQYQKPQHYRIQVLQRSSDELSSDPADAVDMEPTHRHSRVRTREAVAAHPVVSARSSGTLWDELAHLMHAERLAARSRFPKQVAIV